VPVRNFHINRQSHQQLGLHSLHNITQSHLLLQQERQETKMSDNDNNVPMQHARIDVSVEVDEAPEDNEDAQSNMLAEHTAAR